MKEAVVLILDANESMAAIYEEPKSRFDCAKQVCLDMISDLMIRSKTHEVAVLVLKSPITQHHFWEDETEDPEPDVPFPNILELGGDGMVTGVNRPHPNLLRQVHDLQVSSSSSCFRGDFCDGIVVAADALYRRTSTKQYQRRIVLITDAEHKVQVDPQQLLVVLDSLRAMECRLEVIGINFESQAEYERAASAQSTNKTNVESEEGQGLSASNDNNDEESATDLSDDEMEEDDEDDKKLIKHQNEKLLLSLTAKTGGFVMAARELRPILQKVLGQRLPKSTRRKVQFQIAPGLILDARFSLLLCKASTPTLKKRVVELEQGERPDNPNAKVVKDENGKDIVHEFSTLITHWDPEQETKEIEEYV
jgi:ATP-dependent DNA helicase 2 subunit 2